MKLKRIIAAALCLCVLLAAMPVYSSAASAACLRWPVPSCSALSAGFDDGRNHQALDIAASKGSAVIAAASGYVTSTYTGCTHNYGKSYNCCYSLGNHIKIEHTGLTVNSQTISTRYGHLTNVYVKTGDFVNAGDVIGTVGSTGYSTGNHLDFKVYLGSSVIDPAPFLQVPSDLYYCGSDWANNGAYVESLKNNGNTSAGGTTIVTTTTTTVVTSTSVVVSTSGIRLEQGYNYPILLVNGTAVTLEGTVSSSTPISSATVRIISPSGEVKYSATGNVNAYAYNLKNITPRLYFNRLSAGDYVYEIIVTDPTGSYQLLYKPFTVTSGATIAACTGYTYPVCLKPGQSFSIRGNIASTVVLSNVTAAIINSSGAVPYRKSVNPGACVYDLSGVDSALKFNLLPVGTYIYRVDATDTNGDSVQVINKEFYVSNKTYVSGEVSVSGLGYAGNSQSDLSSPYVGKTLSAEVELNPENAPVSYQWYLDSTVLPGQTNNTIHVTQAMLGKTLTVTVIPTGEYFGRPIVYKTRKVISLDSQIGNIIGKDVTYSIDLINQTVSPAYPGTTAAQLISGLLAQTAFSGIYSLDFKKLEDNDVLCTGYTLRSMFLGATVLRYYISVLGDTTKDGKVTAADARIALRAAAGLQVLDAAVTQAADVDQSGKVNAADARIMLRVAAGLEELSGL